MADFVTNTTGTGCGAHDVLLVQLLDVLGQLLAALGLEVVANTGLLDAGTNVHAVAELVDAHGVSSMLKLEFAASQLFALGDGSAAQLCNQRSGHFVAAALFQLGLANHSRATAFRPDVAGEVLLLHRVVCNAGRPCFPFIRVRGQYGRSCHLVFLSMHT